MVRESHSNDSSESPTLANPTAARKDNSLSISMTWRLDGSPRTSCIRSLSPLAQASRKDPMMEKPPVSAARTPAKRSAASSARPRYMRATPSHRLAAGF